MSNGAPLTCASPNLLADFSSDFSHRSVHFFRPAPEPDIGVSSPFALVDERLGAKDGGEREPSGVLGAGFGGIDHDLQVVAGDDEDVAVECDESDVGVVDDLVPGLILGRAGLARLPQLDEARLCEVSSAISRFSSRSAG